MVTTPKILADFHRNEIIAETVGSNLRKTEIHIKKVEYKGIHKLIDFLKYWRKHIFQTGFTEMRKCEINLLAFDNKNKKIGSIYGGISIDQDNYDGEIYSLNCTENDKTDLLKTELFNKIIEEFKKTGIKSVCVEFYKNAEIKDFYLKNEPEFIEEITNYGYVKRISEVYGWKNIAEIKTTANNAYILLLGSSLLTKVLADFLFGFYLLT